MEIPEITEVQRVRIEPGDKLVVHLDASRIGEDVANEIRVRIRALLGLADDFPVLVLARNASVEVMSS